MGAQVVFVNMPAPRRLHDPERRVARSIVVSWPDTAAVVKAHFGVSGVSPQTLLLPENVTCCTLGPEGSGLMACGLADGSVVLVDCILGASLFHPLRFV